MEKTYVKIREDGTARECNRYGDDEDSLGLKTRNEWYNAELLRREFPNVTLNVSVALEILQHKKNYDQTYTAEVINETTVNIIPFETGLWQ